ncbi:putative RNA methyltransferase [Nocardia farcinica]|uniref:Putative ribosomal RNA methyltransferase n=1 Tax=Nocardia farcinica (strain IFM 10152) TaxID=247156 RepID=Q5YQG5_NOCFA|nr:methyltransferase domain-containing protein [Nocardia farcinica]BAD59576.1 putative ribosomal RNA methyltransferase [Nocardia farcinica IFM 10152]
MSPASTSALADVAGLLACPECGQALQVQERALRCARGHSFDIAKQGYVGLLTGASTKMTGDTADMLDARAAFQRGGHFAPIADAVAAALPTGAATLLEVGAGTGYYLARALDAVPRATGIALDVAKPAARRCARAHPRAAAVLADAWRGLPVRDGVLDAVLTVFAPRNPAEAARVLAPDGRYLVVTPTPAHLRELVGPLGMVGVDPDKDRRIATAMAGHFDPAERVVVEYPMALGRADIAQLVGMGPSAHHRDDTDAARLAALPDRMSVTASVTLAVYRPRH